MGFLSRIKKAVRKVTSSVKSVARKVTSSAKSVASKVSSATKSIASKVGDVAQKGLVVGVSTAMGFAEGGFIGAAKGAISGALGVSGLTESVGEGEFTDEELADAMQEGVIDVGGTTTTVASSSGSVVSSSVSTPSTKKADWKPIYNKYTVGLKNKIIVKS